MIRTIISRVYYKIIKRNSVIIKRGGEINLKCSFEGFNRIGEMTHVTTSKFGYGSYTGRNCHIVNTSIGRYCSIGSFIIFTSGTHPVSGFVSSHPAFYSTRKQSGFTFVDHNLFDEYKSDELYQTVVGDDVWIGDGAIVLEGVKIGTGAIIGAGAVVTKDVEPYSVVAGVPARLIKFRFDEEERSFLINSKWWEKDPEWIRQNICLFSDVELLKNSLEEKE